MIDRDKIVHAVRSHPTRSSYGQLWCDLLYTRDAKRLPIGARRAQTRVVRSTREPVNCLACIAAQLVEPTYVELVVARPEDADGS